MSDELDIRLKTTLEADESASIKQIQSQIPSIEKGLKANKIKVPLVADTDDVTKSINESVKKATGSLKTSKSVSIPIEASVNLDIKDAKSIQSDLKRVISEITNDQGEITNLKINMDGAKNAKSVLLTYKNEAKETTTTLLKLKKVGEEVLDGNTTSKFSWFIDANTLQKDIKQLEIAKQKILELKTSADELSKKSSGIASLNFEKFNAAINAGDVKSATTAFKDLNTQYVNAVKNANLLRETQEKAKGLMTDLNKFGGSLDWSAYNKAIDSGNAEEAAKELKLLEIEYVNLGKIKRSQLPDSSIENLPQDVDEAISSVIKLENAFKGLKAKGFQIPENTLTQLSELKSGLEKIATSPVNSESLTQFTKITDQADKLKNTLVEIQSGVRLDNIEKSAQRGSVQIQNLQQKMQNLKIDWSAFLKNPALVAEWQKLFDDTQIEGADKSVSNLNARFGLLKSQIEGAGLAQKTFLGQLGTNIKKFSQWFFIGGSVATAVRSIKELITNVIDLNAAFTDLKIVTGGSDEDVNTLLDSYTKLGKQIGATTKEVANAAADWLRQGKSIADTNTLIYDSLVLSKIANIDTADATDYLTTAMKGYGIAVDDTLGIVDKLSSVDLVSATSAGGLAEGMAQVATNANLAGVSMDKLIGYLAIIGETTGDSMSSVGQSLSTIFSRMGNIKLSKLDEYSNSGEDLSNVETVLRGLGIELRDGTNEFRNFGTVIDEVAAKWTTYGSVQQRAIASAMAGKNHMEEFLVLMQNYDKATEYATVSSEASGTAMSKMAAYEQSLEAKQKKLTASVEDFSNSLVSSGLIGGTYDAGTGIMSFLTQIVDTLGAIPTLASVAAAALSFKNIGLLQKTNAGNLTAFWNTKKANKLLDLDNDISALRTYSAEILTTTDASKTFETVLGKTSVATKNFALAGNLGRDAISGFRTEQEAAIKQTGFFKNALISLKGVAASIGSMLLQMAVAFAVTEAINGLIKFVDYLVVTVDEAKQAAEELASAWKETDDTISTNKKTLDGIASEYAKLSKGVDSFGRNVSLTSDEFERHNELANQIADMFPDLVTGWTDEGTAILSTRGNVDDLTDSLKALVVESNNVKAAALGETLSTFKSAEMSIPTFSWQDTGSELQSELTKQILDAISSGTLNEVASTWGDDQKRILRDVLQGAGFDYNEVTPLWDAIPDILGDPDKLKAYYEKLTSETYTTVENIKSAITGILDLSDEYSGLDDGVKSIISKVVNGIDSEFIASFAKQENGDIALRQWIQTNLVDAFSDFDFSGIIDTKSLFDTSEISVADYSKIYEDFLSTISGFEPEIQAALIEAFSPDTETLVANVQSKLEDAFDLNTTSLTLEDLNIAANLEIPDDTLLSWEELLQLIADTKKAAASTVDVFTTTIESLTTEGTALKTALEEQSKNGYITYDSYQALIDANADYADSFEMVDGQLRLNEKSAYAVAAANNDLALSEAEAALAAKQAEIDKNNQAIADTTKEIESGSYFEPEYDALVAQRDALIENGLLLDSELQQYQAIIAEIKNMESVYNEYLDHIVDKYETLSKEISSSQQIAQSNIDLKVSQGKEITESDYTPLVESKKSEISNLEEELNTLTTGFDEQVASGAIKIGSDVWYGYKQTIDEIKSSIVSANSELISYEDSIRNIGVTNLQSQYSALKEQESGINRNIDFSEANDVSVNADKYKSLISIGDAQIANLESQNSILNEQLLTLDPLSSKYQDIANQIYDNKDSINDVKVSQVEWNEEIKNLPLEYLDKIVEKYKEVQDELSSTEELAQSKIELKTEQGEQIQPWDYSTLVSAKKAEITNLEEELKTLTSIFNEQVASGYIKVGSDVWNEFKQAIQESETSIANANSELISYEDTIRNLDVANLQTKLNGIKDKESQITRDITLSEDNGIPGTLDQYQELIDLGDQEIENYEYQNELLYDELDGLDQASDKYQEINDQINDNQDSINEVVDSQKDWNDTIDDLPLAKLKLAEETLNKGANYDSLKDTQESLKEAIESGRIINDDTQAAVDYMLGGSSAGLSYEDQLERAKLAYEKYKKYFTGDKTGANNFLKDLIGEGLATYENGSVVFGEGVTGAQIAEKMGISEEALKSVLDLLTEYGGKFDYSVLFPDETDTPKEEDNPVTIANSQMGEAVAQYLKDSDTYSNDLLAAYQKIADAANGKVTVTETPELSPTSSGGPSTLSYAPTTPTVPSVKSTVTEQETVSVPVTLTPTVTEKLTVTDMVNGVTVDDTGAASINVTVNANSGTVVEAGELAPEEVPIIPIEVDTDSALLKVTDLDTAASKPVTKQVDVTFSGLDELPPEFNITEDVVDESRATSYGPKTISYAPAEKPKTFPTTEQQTDVVDEPITVTPVVTEKLAISDIIDGVTLDELGSASVDIIANSKAGTVVEGSDLVPEELPVIPIDADTNLAMGKVTSLDSAASKPVTKQVNITYSGSGTLSEDFNVTEEVVDEPNNTSTMQPGPKLIPEIATDEVDMKKVDEELEEKSTGITIPADIDPADLQAKITAAGETLQDITIYVDADTDNGEEKALALKKYIEKLNPTVWVTVKKAAGSAYASGTKNAKDEVALTGEVKPELIEHKSEGTFELVEKPTLVSLNPGDVVHNGSETEKILRRSSTSALSGHAFASGGSVPWTFTGSTSTSSTSSKDYKSSSTSWQKWNDKLFDWIETRLDRLGEKTEEWKRKIEDAIGAFAKNNAIEGTISSVGDQIKAQQEAAAKYQAEANAVAKKSGLSSGIVNKIQNGTMDIALYDDKTKEKIQAYQEWYEKAQSAKDAIYDLEDQLKDLNKQKFDNIKSEYDSMIGVIENASDVAQSNIDLMIAGGKAVKASDYATLIEAQVKKIAQLKAEQDALNTEFNEQLESGAIVENSDAWFEYKETLDSLDSTILKANTDLIDLGDAVDKLEITNFGYALDALKQTESEIQSVLDLIEAQGGTATGSLYEQLIAIGSQEIENLNAQNDALAAQLAGLDPLSEKYQEILGQINANKSSINDIAQSQEQWNDSIIDLKIDELQKTKDALSETNDEYQRQLDLQEAIEDLERAKSQRKIRVLENGVFKYVADTKDVAEKQRAVDEQNHEETLAKIDEAIDALEDSKATNNVYETLGLTATDLTDLYSQLTQASIDSIISSIAGTNIAGTAITDALSSISGLTTAMTTNNTNSVEVNMVPGMVVINADGASAKEIFSEFDTKFGTAITQIMYKK